MKTGGERQRATPVLARLEESGLFSCSTVSELPVHFSSCVPSGKGTAGRGGGGASGSRTGGTREPRGRGRERGDGSPRFAATHLQAAGPRCAAAAPRGAVASGEERGGEEGRRGGAPELGSGRAGRRAREGGEGGREGGRKAEEARREGATSHRSFPTHSLRCSTPQLSRSLPGHVLRKLDLSFRLHFFLFLFPFFFPTFFPTHLSFSSLWSRSCGWPATGAPRSAGRAGRLAHSAPGPRGTPGPRAGARTARATRL